MPSAYTMIQRLAHSECVAHAGKHRAGRASAVRAKRARCRCSAEEAKPLSQSAALDAARARIQQDPRTQANLQRIDDAQRRVLELQAAQQQIQADIDAASSASSSRNGSNSNAAEMAAVADEVSAAAREFSAARAERDAAEDQQRQLRADLQKEEDRLHSALAGAVAAAGGLLVQVPLLAGSQHPPAAKLASLAVTAISSGLFGIVWRYAIRSEQDATDTQLMGGCIAAFGLTSGLGQASALLGGALDQGEALSGQLLAQCALLTGASMLQFTAAAVLLEACLARQIVSRTVR